MDQQDFNLRVAEELGKQSSSLDILLERTEALPALVERVAEHQRFIDRSKLVYRWLGLGAITALLAKLGVHFAPPSNP